MSVTLTGISHTYRKGEPDESRALQGIDLSVSRGETIVLAGRNGSGKSTLLKCMAGLIAPSSGEVTIGGRPPHEARSEIGFAIQSPEKAFFERNLYDDLAFGLRNKGMDEARIETSILTAIGLVGLPRSKLSMSPHSLSHGEKRLAALAGVISLNPEYLFLDEPTSGLDMRRRRDVIAALEKLKSKGMTIIATTHAPGHLQGLCDRYIILDQGRIVSDSKPSEIISTSGLESAGLYLNDSILLARKLNACGFSITGAPAPGLIADSIYKRLKEAGR